MTEMKSVSYKVFLKRIELINILLPIATYFMNYCKSTKTKSLTLKVTHKMITSLYQNAPKEMYAKHITYRS